MRKRGRAGQRPETAGNATEHYGGDAQRYTDVNKQRQLELATACRRLLALAGGAQEQEQEQRGRDPGASAPAPCRPLLMDIGCGSGLSSAALQGCEWVGVDISPAMLTLAQQQPGCTGRLALADMSQGLPLRPACLDGAISVSAAQWLCAHSQPTVAMRRLFGGLHTALRPGARAALQVYLEGEAGAGAPVLIAPAAAAPTSPQSLAWEPALGCRSPAPCLQTTPRCAQC